MSPGALGGALGASATGVLGRIIRGQAGLGRQAPARQAQHHQCNKEPPSAARHHAPPAGIVMADGMRAGVFESNVPVASAIHGKLISVSLLSAALK